MHEKRAENNNEIMCDCSRVYMRLDRNKQVAPMPPKELAKNNQLNIRIFIEKHLVNQELHCLRSMQKSLSDRVHVWSIPRAPCKQNNQFPPAVLMHD